MHLPLTVDIEGITRDDLRSPRFWSALALVLAGFVAAALLLRAARPAPAPAPAASASLAITSTPTGATILVAGRERGRTPATLALPPGDHRVTLRLAGRADITYAVQLDAEQRTSLEGVLWGLVPTATQIRPPLPGATIAGAQFLADGRVALVVALPSGDERQLWLLDRDGGAHRVGPSLARVAIAAAPDGERVAYLARPAAGQAGTATGLAADTLATEVWITSDDDERGERRYALPPNTAAERLVDLSWSPDGAGLLLVSQQRPPGGGARTRLLWLDLAPPSGTDTSAPRELITLPSELVAGAYSWSPAGDRVALLARSDGRTALCLLDLADGRFRSLADVAVDGRRAPPFPPLSWRGGGTDGGTFTYAAPPIGSVRATGFSLGSAPATQLFTADPAAGPGQHPGATEGETPGWRDDGLLLALARPHRSGPPILRAFDPRAGGAPQDLGTFPPPIGMPDGVCWDMPRGQALVAVRGRGAGGDYDLWLVRWAEHDEEVGR